MNTAEQQLEVLWKEVETRMEQIREIQKKEAYTVVEDLEFTVAEGKTVRLSELFGAKTDLIFVHNMGRGCTYCTLWADGLNGVVKHLSDRAAFVVGSPDTPEIQRQFADSRGWEFPMVSVAASDFTKKMGFSMEREGKTFYLPGFSTFAKSADGTITRIGKDFFGPGDVYAGIWHIFEYLEGGAGNWQPRYRYDEQQ